MFSIVLLTITIICSFAFLGVIAVRIYKGMVKLRIEETRAKDARAAYFVNTTTNLIDTIRERTIIDRENADSTASTLRAMTRSISRMHNDVQILTRKVDGKAAPEESARVISRIIMSSLYHEAHSVIEVSMRENDYDNRREYVREKVVTSLSRVVADTAETCRELPISIDLALFFPLNLAEHLWDTVEALFEHTNSLQQRLEEMRLRLGNKINTHAREVTARIENGEAEGKTTSLMPTMAMAEAG